MVGAFVSYFLRTSDVFKRYETNALLILGMLGVHFKVQTKCTLKKQYVKNHMAENLWAAGSEGYQ